MSNFNFLTCLTLHMSPGSLMPRENECCLTGKGTGSFGNPNEYSGREPAGQVPRSTGRRREEGATQATFASDRGLRRIPRATRLFHAGRPHMSQVKFGKIIFENTEVPCTIGTLSKLGACLIVQSTHGIPALFKIVMLDRAPMTCKVIWRDDKRLGVHFR